MVDRKSREVFDEPPPPSSTRRRDQQALIVICGILGNRFGVSAREVHFDSRFVEDLGIDAFDLPDLILALEEAFELDISIALAARILTVKDAIRCALAR